MYLREKPVYETWEDFWEKSYSSPYFKAKYDEDSEKTDWSLSERQLFTQSNGRTLLGQDTMGRLHFVCTPHKRIYAVPSGGPHVGGQFQGHIGQYYQNDTALFLGKIKYGLEMDNGLFLSAANRESETEYIDYFLPVTKTVYPGIELKIFSLAPILEKEASANSSIHPLPGPAGVHYNIEIKNTSGGALEGKLRLDFEQRFVHQFEAYGKKFEDYTVKPYREEWDQKLLILWHPQACAAVQFLGAVCEGEANNPRIYVPFSLKEGESKVFTTVIAIVPERKEIHENLGILYQHTTLEWLNVTARFWKERLGENRTEIREDREIGEKYRDMCIRFLLDNFNCLSFDQYGNLLTNWQGAPSHSLSRLWGIDIEPDVVSVMYAVPEIGPRAIEYLLERNTPRYSIYSDHSMFFYISPLLIAGKYLELTGDWEYFRSRSEILLGLEKIFQGMMQHKHKEKALFSSRYASDLIVFKKYDYGANVQCFYALKSYVALKRALGETVSTAEKVLRQMPKDMRECMEGEGPFGRQITGGTSLGECREERFYIPEELYYYGGEDTATVLAPLYGLYEFDYEPYVNLHRFARSMFITNYDPEFQTMRELHFGMNPSATGCTLKLGGSYTRKEMLENLRLLYDRLDETGSLFWWPRAYNKKRCLTRCSQGQGAWLQQSIEQWYGLRMDAIAETLTIKPQGLLTSYILKDFSLGTFSFTIEYQENEGETYFKVINHNEKRIRIIFFARPFGAGAEGSLKQEEIQAGPGETVEKSISTERYKALEAGIVERECRCFGEKGLIFSPYGIVMPKLYSGICGIFLFRFVLSYAGEEALENIEVELQVPEEWRVASKGFYHWDYQPVFLAKKAICRLKSLSRGERSVAGFYVHLPRELWGDEKSVMLSEHPFSQNGKLGLRQTNLYVEGHNRKILDPVRAILRAGGKELRRLELPVKILEKERYEETFDLMYHGEKL